jgi:hypothetical protein
MNTFSACVDAAFQRAKTLLWPIQKNVWLKLFVLFLFTGGCGSYVGNIGNVKSFKDLSKNNTGPTQAAPAAPDKDTMVITSQAVSEFIAEVKGVIKSAWEKYRLYVYAAAAVFFMFLIFFFVVGIWFTSRLEVTLISILREGIVEIGRHWRQTESLGWSLFVFRLWIYALCAIVFLPLIGVGLGGIAYAIKHSMTALAVLFGLGMFFLVVVTIVTSLALWALMKFLPAVMCEFNESPRSGARRLWQWLSTQPGSALSGVFLYILVSVAVGVAVAIALVLLVLALVFMAVLLSLALALIIKGTVAKGILVVVGMTAAVIFAAFLMMMGSVPAGTFLTYLRIELIARALSRTPQSSPHAAA